MPKRLLRYALSRLELLEEETLDLDNLDFSLGRNTTFEFKDVGVRLKVRETAGFGHFPPPDGSPGWELTRLYGRNYNDY